jgi:hypothetical protein
VNTGRNLNTMSFQEQNKHTTNNLKLLHLPTNPALSFLSPKSFPNPSQVFLPSPSHQPLMQNQDEKLSEPVFRRGSTLSSFKRGSQARIRKTFLQAFFRHIEFITC